MEKILFTGARSGIAQSVIEKLAKDNYFIYITVHTKKEEKIIKGRYKGFKNVSCFKLDVTSSEDRKKLEDIDIDILVSNAAVGFGGSLIEIPISKLKENYEVNVFANIEIIKLVLKKMIEKKKGKIIIMSSIAGIIPIEFLGSYCSTKSSLIMLAKVLKKELKLLGVNIKIKVIEPGIYKTGFNEVMLDNKDLEESKYFKNKEKKIRLKEYLMFDVMGKDNLDSIRRKIIKAIKSNNNKFVYSAPLSQRLFAKIYQIFKG